MASGKPCQRCGEPKAAGRLLYCGDSCRQAVLVEREQTKKAARMMACRRCSGPKEVGVRGGKYCAECRRLQEDTTSALERERSRRRQIRTIEERLAAGEKLRRRLSDAPDGQKWCARCQEFRPHASFAMHKGKPAAYCRPCNKIYNAERRLLLVYGMTWDEYELLLDRQDGRCAICGGRPRKCMLAVDHDHKTGEIRGLLCSKCNHKLLGSANDDPGRLRKAADYLEAYGPRQAFGTAKFMPGYGKIEEGTR